MQTKSKIAFGAAALVGVAALIGVSQFANAGSGKGWGHMGGKGGHHGMGMVEEFRDRYDGNKDGKITQEEINQNRVATLGEFDADKNNALSLAEFEALWLKARNLMMVREFQQFDANGDGSLTLEEYQKPMQDIVARMDHNGDQALSLEDQAKGKGRHRMMTPGGDGAPDAPPPEAPAQ